MPRRFRAHARARMKQRRISQEDVESALNRPTGRVIPGQLGSKWVFGYDTSGRIIKVCVSTDDQDLVITVARPDEG